MDPPAAPNASLAKPEDDTDTPFDLFQIPDSVELLRIALEENCIDVNQRNENGKTLLLQSIELDRSDEFIITLLNANADPNISDQDGQVPLIKAIGRTSIIVAEELLKKGADVNASIRGFNALYEAIESNNFEAICLLLYYGGDVNALSDIGGTPFWRALTCRDLDACNVMVNYYDGCLDDVLHFPIQFDTDLCVKLLEMGGNVNYVACDDDTLLETCVIHDNFVMFQLIWERIDSQILLKGSGPFLLNFLEYASLGSKDWLEVLNMILISPVADMLAKHCNTHLGFFEKLFNMFKRFSVTNISERMRFVYLALSLNIEVSIDDAISAYHLFGFEDLEVLIYFVNDYDCKKYHSDIIFQMTLIFLGIEDDLNVTPGWRIFEHEIHDKWLGYFSRSCYTKALRPEWLLQYLSVGEALVTLPEFPSLLELSRKQSRIFIRQTYNVKKPREFHDAVKSLNLPEYIKNVIRFKVPIYSFSLENV